MGIQTADQISLLQGLFNIWVEEGDQGKIKILNTIYNSTCMCSHVKPMHKTEERYAKVLY